jgi:hypothetical protein
VVFGFAAVLALPWFWDCTVLLGLRGGSVDVGSD